MLPIKPFYYFSKLFGLCPYALDGVTKSQPGKTRFSQIGHLLPTFTVLLFYNFSMASIMWRSGNASNISNAANWIQLVPNSFAYLSGLIYAFRNRKIASDILATFALCDEKLCNKFGICFVEPNQKVRRASVVACLATVICGGALSGLNFMIGVDWFEFWTLFYWIVFCMPKVAQLLFSFQFAGSIILLSNRTMLLLKGMNNYLDEIDQQRQWNSLALINFSNQDPVSYRKATPATTRASNIKVRPLYPPSDATENFRQVAEYLQQLATKINDCFGKQAIFSLLSAFICITVQLYYLLNQIRAGFSQPGAVIHGMAAGSMLLLHGVELWVLLTSGEQARNKWRKLINFLILTKATSNDDSFRGKIDDLVSFMTCNPPEFHAYGFFPIDFSILTGMTAAITTYLIVLIQFKIAEEESGKPRTETDRVGSSSQFAPYQGFLKPISQKQ
ncbi:putative gustatory receptor 2a [Topomyia yanbarensis]|uniref:putative gustatory receptor 2a n=1 Tax=Topomyia yanbarensis TaxID=2498891 RepID=UPI00273BBAB0|nr:putative gustatory receptor 2a [Topomyia yanbarensis]